MLHTSLESTTLQSIQAHDNLDLVEESDEDETFNDVKSVVALMA